MPTYNKLVRDRIPEIIRRNGDTPITHVADAPEYREKLRAKLTEEVDEYLSSSDAHELVDIIEVCFALAQLDGLSPLQLQMLRLRKTHTNGSFRRRIILEKVTGDA